MVHHSKALHVLSLPVGTEQTNQSPQMQSPYRAGADAQFGRSFDYSIFQPECLPGRLSYYSHSKRKTRERRQHSITGIR